MPATWLVAACIVTIYSVQIALASAGMLDLAAAATADLVVIAGLSAFARGRLVALGVRRPAFRFALAGVLVGSSLWYLDLRLVTWINPPGNPTPLQHLVAQAPLAATLLAIAVLPAIAEEMMFRGVLARALARRSRLVAIVGSSLAFSAYHLLPLQIIATFPLGLAVAYLALRADSIVPAVIAHFLNNAIAVVISRDEVPAIGAWIGGHPSQSALGSVVLVTAGLAIAARAPAR